MAFAGGFDGARKIREGCVIDFERNGIEAVSRIAEGHLTSMAQKAEAGDVGDGVNWLYGLRLFFNFLESGSGSGVESAHGADGGSKRFGGRAILFQGCSDYACSKRLGKEKYVARLGSYVAPNSLRID